jgi:tetratricopeptide (TPR) repeat protein
MLRVHSAWLLALFLLACKHVPTEKERRSAEIHYELGVQAQLARNEKAALMEYQKALELDPDYPEANNAIGILLHLAFNRPDEAILHYQKALEVRPNFSEAKTNLANVYLTQARYDDAIKLYDAALNDMLYATPYIAQGNLGWAFYKKGEVERGIQNIKAAVTSNPDFCLGYKNLGIIYQEIGNPTESCVHYTRYREKCTDEADAWMREGVCQARQGKPEVAKESFTTCEAKAKDTSLKDDCRRLREAL